MAHQHSYTCQTKWTGNRGEGTRNFKSFDRNWEVITAGQIPVKGTADPQFGGLDDRPNPEQLLLSSLSACHMLWYLALAASSGIVVLEYTDNPIGTGEVESSGVGKFLSAVLRPHIVLAEGTDIEKANKLHSSIGSKCFIARSVNFPVAYEATYSQA